MSFAGPLINALYQAWPREGQSWAVLAQRALHTFFVSCVIVVLAQQTSAFAFHWQTAVEERAQVEAAYAEDCVAYRGRNQALLADCSRMNIVLQAAPLTRALMRFTAEWHSCLWAPCTELASLVASQLQYRLLLVLLALALASYAFRLFRCAKQRGTKDAGALLAALEALAHRRAPDEKL